MKIVFSYFLSSMIRIMILCICFLGKTYAQNLVPNSSFEVYAACPNGPELVDDAPPWNKLSGLGGGTPDYFNKCATYLPYGVPSNVWGFQEGHSGNAYSFVAVYVSAFQDMREYIQIELKDSLKIGFEYCVEFYVSPADSLVYGADGIGAYFSKTSVYSATDLVLPYIAQVNNPAGNILTNVKDWIKISGSFIASGGEQYMIIGNFKNDKNTKISLINSKNKNVGAGYYIDDVSVQLVEKVNAGLDQSICLEDSIQIGTISNEVAIYSWSPATGLSNSNAAQPMASPTETTIYILTKTTACDVSKDSVKVIVKDDCNFKSSIILPNIFTPNNDGTNDVFKITSENIAALNLKIYNRWGVLIKELKNINEEWDGRTTAGLECTDGVYYYILTARGTDDKEYDEKGFVQLIR